MTVHTLLSPFVCVCRHRPFSACASSWNGWLPSFLWALGLSTTLPRSLPFPCRPSVRPSSPSWGTLGLSTTPPRSLPFLCHLSVCLVGAHRQEGKLRLLTVSSAKVEESGWVLI